MPTPESTKSVTLLIKICQALEEVVSKVIIGNPSNSV